MWEDKPNHPANRLVIELLADFRKKNNITFRTLAKLIGVSSTYCHHLMRPGCRGLSFPMALRILDVMGMRLAKFEKLLIEKDGRYGPLGVCRHSPDPDDIPVVADTGGDRMHSESVEATL